METFVLEWETDVKNEASGLTLHELLKIAECANELYKVVNIKKGVKIRVVEIPEEALKKAQRLLLKHYLPIEDVHPCTYSYKPESSLLDHVEGHKNYSFTLKIDLKDFFESIPENIVSKYFSAKHPPELATILTKIACRKGRLPIGAPSSPMLSNVLLYEMDRHWHTQIGGEAVYTRYADDIYFSADSKELLVELLPKFEEYLNKFYPFLKINKQKTAFLHGDNRKITGLVIVSNETITIGRKRKRELRALLDYYCKGLLLDEDQVASLRGKLLFTQGHDYPYFEKLKNRYQVEIAEIYAWGKGSTPQSIDEQEHQNIATHQDKIVINSSGGAVSTIQINSRTHRMAEATDLIKRYLNLGWKLLPCYSWEGLVCACGKVDCKSPGKHPSVKHGVYDATSNLAELQPWIEKGCNFAVATGFPSGIVVLDVDVRKGGYGSYQKLQNFIDPKMLNTLQCKTGSGGMHLYFSYPSTMLKNRNGVLPGIDFKTDGGYVIAPPSNHVSGGVYEWLDKSMLEQDCIKPLPESLLEVLKASESYG